MLKKYYRESVFVRILTFSLIPVFIVSSFAVILQIFQTERMKEREIESAAEMFESSMMRIEEDVDEIITSFELLYSDDNIKKLMFLSEKSQMSIFQKYEIKNTLTKTKNIYDFISNVAIVNCANDFVIDTNRECSFSVYFTTQRQYADYDPEFWRSVSKQKEFYTFLPPVTVLSGERQELVFPLIISCMNGIKSKSYIIVDIRADYVYKIATQNELFRNESVVVTAEDAVYNVKTGEKTRNQGLSEQIKDKKIFRYTENKTEYVGFRYNNKISYFGSRQFVRLIPKNVLMRDIYINMYLMMFFILLVVIINVFLCYFFNKKLYQPIESIKKVLEASNYKRENFENEFELIEKSFSEMVFENVLLKEDAQKMLSVSKEQYLIKNLDVAESDDEKKLERVFQDSNIIFRQEYFLVAHIEVSYSKEFFQKFNSEQYMHICSGIYSFLYAEFNDEESVILSKSNEAFVVIFNLKKENSGIVFDRLDQLEDAFQFDTELVKLRIGVGQIHRGLSGLRASYGEAKRAYWVLQSMPYRSILQYNVADEKTVSFQYSMEQENKLFNYIIGGNLPEIMHLVEEIALQNYEYGGDPAVKKAYNQIMQTALRAATVKGMDYNKLIDENGMDADTAFEMLRSEEFVRYVNLLLRQVTQSEEQKNRAVDIKEIVEFLNAHCAEELYLDNVAEHFGISGKYLSKLIKAKLGLGFNQYVSMVKIEKAKELLVTTDYRINDIMTMTGFVSKTTFLRVFKKFEGITPGEYRNLFKSLQDKKTDHEEGE